MTDTPGDPKTPDQTMRVQRWGAPTRGGRRAYRLPEHAQQQLLLGHRMANDLVEISRRADEMIEKVWASYPGIRTIDTEIDRLRELAAELAAELARRKSAARSRKLTGADAEVRDDLTAVRALIRAKTAERKAAKAAVKIDARARLKQVSEWTKAETKRIRQEYAAQGLYWGTYNDVIAHHQSADKRVAQRRQQGRPAQRRFRRWDGSGSLAVQLQRATGDPPRTTDRVGAGDALPDGKVWTGQLQLPRTYGRGVHGVVRVGTGSGKPMVAVPVTAHRALPDGADITGARIVVERVAGQTHTSVHVTAKIPAPEPKVQGPTIAIHVGWRRDPGHHGLRAATWRSDVPVQVPPHLAGVVVQETPVSGWVVLPDEWRRRMAAMDTIRSHRELRMNEVRGRVVEWLTTHPQPVEDGEELTGGRVKGWKSPARLAALAARWRTSPPIGDGGEDLAAMLEAWRRWDKLRWEREAHGRRKIIGRRRDAYRKVAAWIAGTAWRVVVDDADLAQIARAQKTGEVLPGKAEDAAARARVDVAPGELRAAVVAAASREGCSVIEADLSGRTRTHIGCGFENPADGRYAVSAVVSCDGCGGKYDQDSNVVAGMIQVR